DVSPGVDGPPVMPEDPYAYVVAAFQTLPPPDYVSGPEEPEQAPPSPFTYLMYQSRSSPPLQLLSSDHRADRPEKMAPKKAAPKRTTRLNLGTTPNPNSAPSTTTITVTNAQLQAMIDQGVNATLAARDANRTGDDSHTSGTGVRRTEHVIRECTYQDFMKCQPLYFKGTEGVVELTQWFEMIETVFRISNCLAENQIELKKKMTDKYCPRNEMKKIKTEFWNLEVQGTDVTRYNQRFQELALLYVRTCPEESDRVERNIGGLPDIIHGSVAASKPKTMQEATEMATGLMDKKIRTYAKR
nr:hypothetical protein [Tanacetum cinerariifolium]